MKKIMLAVLLAILLVTPAFAAPTLWWTISGGVPDGYILYHKVLTDTIYQEVAFAAGPLWEYDLSQLNWIGGVRYEMYLVGTKSGSESAPSDIVRYTYPIPQQIIEIPETNQVIINIGVRP